MVRLLVVINPNLRALDLQDDTRLAALVVGRQDGMDGLSNLASGLVDNVLSRSQLHPFNAQIALPTAGKFRQTMLFRVTEELDVSLGRQNTDALRNRASSPRPARFSKRSENWVAV